VKTAPNGGLERILSEDEMIIRKGGGIKKEMEKDCGRYMLRIASKMYLTSPTLGPPEQAQASQCHEGQNSRFGNTLNG
jgi:hypothetical protein